MLSPVGVLKTRYPQLWHGATRLNHAVWHTVETLLHFGLVPVILFLGLKASGPSPSALPVFLPFGTNFAMEPKPVYQPPKGNYSTMTTSKPADL